DPALPLNPLWRLRILEGEELVKPLHILVVVAEASFRNPWTAAEHVLGGETLLVVVIGAVIRPIEIESGIQTIRSIPRVAHRQVAILGHQEVTSGDKVVLRALAPSCAFKGSDVFIGYSARPDNRQGRRRQGVHQDLGLGKRQSLENCAS